MTIAPLTVEASAASTAATIVVVIFMMSERLVPIYGALMLYKAWEDAKTLDQTLRVVWASYIMSVQGYDGMNLCIST